MKTKKKVCSGRKLSPISVKLKVLNKKTIIGRDRVSSNFLEYGQNPNFVFHLLLINRNIAF